MRGLTWFAIGCALQLALALGRDVLWAVYTALHYEFAFEFGTRSDPPDEVVNEVRDREQVIRENKGIWPSRSGDQV